MKKRDLLRSYGLFDANVPRYTSYPPANRFEHEVGQQNQLSWLQSVPPDEPLSIYVHIPFCRRLCWFCACRTQGTWTLAPVDAYVASLEREIDATGKKVGDRRSMARLHLGGGTPTLLSPAQMNRLLSAVHRNFARASGFEFSVEIDPTEASDEVLLELGGWGLNRASIGVQDFAKPVQSAIGRAQSFDQTAQTAARLRALGVGSLNIDFLYGLPHQNEISFAETVTQVLALNPDRMALYGYAHVPHVSKRQVMINADTLPSPEMRFDLARSAERLLVADGYVPLGIDHFALPSDGLALAAGEGRMRRNFQGYTDDPCETLIGFGASAISQFRQGYAQNAVATAAYQERVLQSGFAGSKGYAVTGMDRVVGRMIEMLMCGFSLDSAALEREFPERKSFVRAAVDKLAARFPAAVTNIDGKLTIDPDMKALVRLVAGALDVDEAAVTKHSLAV